MIRVLLTIVSLTGAYWAWSLVRLVQNYILARRIGLTILISPVSITGPLWMLTERFVGPIILKLPWGLGDWAHRGSDWTFQQRFALHEQFGEAFTVVTPGDNLIYLAEPTAVEHVLRRRNDFIKDPELYRALEVYGPNLDTVNGKVWDQHRKVTVPPFSEHNSALVWRESAKQVDRMLDRWLGQDQVTTTVSDVVELAMNVLCGAGFGLDSGMPDTDRGPCDLGYLQSLRTLLEMKSVILLKIIRDTGMPLWMQVGPLKQVSQAHAEFKRYLGAMVAQEKTAFAQGDVSRHNLMSALVRASEQANGAGSTAAGLSDDEVYGNLYLFTFAGHDTTANALNFAITMLAIFPEWQAWIGEEIDSIRGSESTSIHFYEATFPRLQRCLALMYETLRLYAPVQVLPRYTGASPQRLRIRDRDHVIPPQTAVMVNLSGLHTHPSHWGTDAGTFRPGRWFVPGGETDSLFQPAPGSFQPWTGGPRVCPGRKFSQVEFCRVLFGLLARKTRVHLVAEPGETEQDARTRALRIVNEAEVGLALRIPRPERIRLRWTRGTA